VHRTGDIGAFKVTVERGIAAGVRRIEAVTGRGAVELFQSLHRTVRDAATRFNVGPERLLELIDAQEKRVKELEQQVKGLKLKLASGGGAELEVQEIAGVRLLVREAPPMSPGELRSLADTLRDKLHSGVVVLGMAREDAATLLVAVTDDLAGRISAGEMVRRLAPVVDGRGGGKASLAQAGGKAPGKLGEALAAAPAVVRELLG
jgi:alanyl-tRNA synthetase